LITIFIWILRIIFKEFIFHILVSCGFALKLGALLIFFCIIARRVRVNVGVRGVYGQFGVDIQGVKDVQVALGLKELCFKFLGLLFVLLARK
jgi:hypothetical protein